MFFADLLKKAAPSRIIFVSSNACFTHNMTTLDRLNNPLNYGDDRTHIGIYSNSKLCILMASNIFAEKLEEFGITSNALHPGCVATPIIFDTLYVLDHRRVRTLFVKTLLFIMGKV